MLRKLLVVLLLSMFPMLINAATLYVGSGETYTTIPLGIAAMSAGDTLIIRDGTYSGNITALPVGTNWTTGKCVIQAEHDGLVISTGTFSFTTGAYTEIHGLKFQTATGITVGGSNIKFFSCGFVGGPTSGSDVFIANNRYILYEDCWFVSTGGRYTMIAWQNPSTLAGADYIVWRRCVFRHDGGYTFDGSNPEACLAWYGARYNALQNCIFLDSISADRIDGTPNSNGEYQGTIYITNHADQSDCDHLEITGCLFIGNRYVDINADPYMDVSVSISNAFLGGSYAPIAAYGQGTAQMTYTLANVTGYNFSANLFYQNTGGTINATNSCFWAFAARGTVDTETYNNSYNPNDVFVGTGHTGVNPATSGILYPTRVEASSVLKTSGSSGGPMGATILKKIGVSGTLYGESGYADLTDDDLWPFPNEDRIKADLEVVDDRGFTAYSGMDGTHNTLTSYIWEYLGNQIPSDIYGSTPALQPTMQGCSLQGGGN